MMTLMRMKMSDKSSLGKEFAGEVEAAIQECMSLGYTPTTFLQMKARWGAVAAAKKLVVSGDIQTGFKRLKAMGRIDLSLEYLMKKEKYHTLFTQGEREAAEWRLSNLGD